MRTLPPHVNFFIYSMRQAVAASLLKENRISNRGGSGCWRGRKRVHRNYDSLNGMQQRRLLFHVYTVEDYISPVGPVHFCAEVKLATAYLAIVCCGQLGLATMARAMALAIAQAL
ncbi:hypothetical protein EVAR_40564_1 [Eumeta japonica]|uniref:Uncharacterized protein n=1 Tax=Eumeta variegata TaxID=151549 RepID=A0A4C1VYV9_EUMVA|nr:hypothetical protein EVAR_40564_1 [Eumeta japonica]